MGKGWRNKGASKYLKASGIVLFREEGSESIEVDVKMPEKEGRYMFWIPIYSNEGSCGFEKLWLDVAKGALD